MSERFRQQLSAQIAEAEAAEARLLAKAEEALRRGDLTAYWVRARPGFIGDLWRIAGDKARALAYEQAATERYRAYRALFEAAGVKREPTLDEGVHYLLARCDDLALEVFRALRGHMDDEEDDQLGIMFYCAGAIDEGRVILRATAARLAAGPQDARQQFKLAEASYWLAGPQAALPYAERSISLTAEPTPSQLALQLLFASLVAGEELPTAVPTLEASVRWLYYRDLVANAADMQQYLELLLGKITHEELRIRGVTMSL